MKVAKSGALGGAARRVVLGVEVEHELLAALFHRSEGAAAGRAARGRARRAPLLAPVGEAVEERSITPWWPHRASTGMGILLQVLAGSGTRSTSPRRGSPRRCRGSCGSERARIRRRRLIEAPALAAAADAAEDVPGSVAAPVSGSGACWIEEEPVPVGLGEPEFGASYIFSVGEMSSTASERTRRAWSRAMRWATRRRGRGRRRGRRCSRATHDLDHVERHRALGVVRVVEPLRLRRVAVPRRSGQTTV